MPQIMVEAFARGLLDKIMLEAFDSLDTAAQDGNPDNDPESPRMHGPTYVDLIGTDTREMIEKLVHGLSDVQIGDSAPASAAPISRLEKQIKRAACHIGAAPPAETRHAQGQGDVRQMMDDAIVVEPCEPAAPSEQIDERQIVVPSEATGVTVGLLHRMIEELERDTDAVEDERRNEDGSIGAWEEREERLVRTIVGTEEDVVRGVDWGVDVTAALKPERRDPESTAERGESMSASALNTAASAKSAFARHGEVGEIGDIVPSPLPSPAPTDEVGKTSTSTADAQEVPSARGTKLRKEKRGLGSRMRKFLRSAFGTRRN